MINRVNNKRAAIETYYKVNHLLEEAETVKETMF